MGRVHWKDGVGGIPEKPIYRGNCLKRALGQFPDLRRGGAWQKTGGWCFEGDKVDTLMHTMPEKRSN